MLGLEDISSLLSYKEILIPQKGDSQISDPTRRETCRKVMLFFGKMFINPIDIYYSRHKGYRNEQMCAIGFWKHIKMHRHENRIQDRNKHFMYLRYNICSKRSKLGSMAYL